eukprot:CAMPEP_0197057700 /NCGR_PEP_ID=MMETSP1384-20130603/99894_1 /TAXON_ID=29189 /ORGANISM="Ammonia sp." /LENGTH=69 /DNA_ID=CAMNT_0042492211 /DNA_START=144 /DNA_END=350 /DNA_ORIENTATION=-
MTVFHVWSNVQQSIPLDSSVSPPSASLSTSTLRLVLVAVVDVEVGTGAGVGDTVPFTPYSIIRYSSISH